MNYGKSIKIIRSATGLNQNDFAKVVGLDPSLLSRYESGERPLSEEFIMKVTQKLRVPIELLKLMSAEESELKNLTEQEASRLGLALMRIITHAEENINK